MSFFNKSSVIRVSLGKYLSFLTNTYLILFISILFGSQIISAIAIPTYGAWGMFHYYLGGKYEKELGYFSLYSCTLQVRNPKLNTLRYARDLRNYRIVPVTQISRCPLQNFTPHRWSEFSKDTDFILEHAPTDFWTDVLTDKGFNPSPFWAAIAGSIANSLPLNTTTYLILGNLDLLLLLLTGAFIGYVSGFRIGLVSTFMSLLFFGTFLILGNNFLQYVWYPLLAVSYITWQKKYPLLSGVAMGVATGLQGFPLVFAIAVLCSFIFSFIRREKDRVNIQAKFLLSYLVALLACILIGSMYTQNMNVWQQWSQKIALHKQYIRGEIFSIGFVNTFGIILSPDHSSSKTYTQDSHHTIQRNNEISSKAFSIEICTLILFIFTLFIMWRTKELNPLIFGYFFLYLFLSLSPYYYLALALLPYFIFTSARRYYPHVLTTVFFLFLIHLILFGHEGYVSFSYKPHLISKFLIFSFFVTLALFLERCGNELKEEKKLNLRRGRDSNSR